MKFPIYQVRRGFHGEKRQVGLNPQRAGIMNLLLFIEIVKVILALVLGLAPIAVLMRDWRHSDRRTKEYHQFTTGIIIAWGISSVLSAIMISIEPYLKETITEHQKSKLKPEVKVDIQEREKEIVVTLESTKPHGGIIDDLFFKFDIPGKFTSAVINNKQKMEHVQIYPTFLAGVGNDTIAQTVHIYCKTVFPHGFFRANILYTPTQVRSVPGSEKLGYKLRYMPLMDLHDFSRILYTWKYMNQSIAETDYIDLTFLDYIRQDNENFLKVWRKEYFWKRINPPNLDKILDSVRTKWSDEWLSEFEQKRKDW